MNHIKRLQAENADMARRIAETDEAIVDFISLLNSPKHNGVDANGDRSDWIATSDALRQLGLIRDSLYNVGFIG